MSEKKSEIDAVLRLIDIEIHKKGWKRKNLVEALGKSDAWLSKIMNKKRGISIPILFDIARVLEIDPKSLLPETKNPEIKISFEEYIRNIVKDENKSILDSIKELKDLIEKKKEQ